MEGGREEVWLPSDVECTCSPASRVLCVRVVSPCVCVCVSARARVSSRLLVRVCMHDHVCACVCSRDVCARVRV